MYNLKQYIVSASVFDTAISNNYVCDAYSESAMTVDIRTYYNCVSVTCNYYLSYSFFNYAYAYYRLDIFCKRLIPVYGTYKYKNLNISFPYRNVSTISLFVPNEILYPVVNR